MFTIYIYIIQGGSCFATNTSESCMCQIGFYGAFCEFSQNTTSYPTTSFPTTSFVGCRNTTCYNG